MPAPTWPTQQLTEFLVLVSGARDVVSVAQAAVERVADALDCEVAAIICGGAVISSVGYPNGEAPAEDIAAVASASSGARLLVPGFGQCPASAVLLDHPPGAALVVARARRDGLSWAETSLLTGMAQVASMTIRMFNLLEEERAARQKADYHVAENARLLQVLTERQELLERLVDEQAALRRVATLVAGEPDPDRTFAAVADEVVQLFGADGSAICRFEPDGSMTILASRFTHGRSVPAGTRVDLDGAGVAAMVSRSSRAARLDSYEGLAGPAVDLLNELGLRAAVASPIVVEGRLWGTMAVLGGGPLPPDTEERTESFADLIATAIANAESRAQLAASRARLVAAADEARRRLERDLHDGTQQRLVSLALELRAAAELASPEGEDLKRRLSDIARGLASAHDDLQELTRGIHPAILTEGGLVPAFKMLARRSPVPVELDLHVHSRLPDQVEVALYYVTSEALTNVAKYAQAAVVGVSLWADDMTTHLAVRDDGVGGADPSRGSGLTGLRDRVEALGGSFKVMTTPGKGTSVEVAVPTGPGKPGDRSLGP